MKNGKINNGSTVIKEGKKWINNKLNKLLKSVKNVTVNLFSLGEVDMKYFYYACLAIAFAITVNAGANMYAVYKGVSIHQDVTISVVKMEDKK
ncbi:hypothetical protein D9M68_19560 [compost metagenome]